MAGEPEPRGGDRAAIPRADDDDVVLVAKLSLIGRQPRPVLGHRRAAYDCATVRSPQLRSSESSVRARAARWAAGLLAVAALCAGVAATAAPARASELVEIEIPDRNGEIPDMWLPRYPNGGPPRARVLLPDGYDPAKPYPLLLLLVGLNSHYTDWSDRGQGEIATTAKGLDAIVVMPEGGDGWYADWWNNGRRGSPAWESYILDQVLPQVLERYRIRPERRYHALAGVSMGGLGTAFLGGRLPGFFGSVAVISGLVDLELILVEGAVQSAIAAGERRRAVGPRGRRGAAARLLRDRPQPGTARRQHGADARLHGDRRRQPGPGQQPRRQRRLRRRRRRARSSTRRPTTTRPRCAPPASTSSTSRTPATTIGRTSAANCATRSPGACSSPSTSTPPTGSTTRSPLTASCGSSATASTRRPIASCASAAAATCWRSARPARR